MKALLVNVHSGPSPSRPEEMGVVRFGLESIERIGAAMAADTSVLSGRQLSCIALKRHWRWQEWAMHKAPSVQETG